MEEKSNSALNFDARNVSLGKNYLLVGAEAYLSDGVQKQISGKLRQDQDIDISTIYADEVKSGDLIEYLDTFTIFSSSKLIVIKNCEKYLKKELEIIAAYFDAPSEIQTVVLITEKIDLKYNAWKTIKKNCEYVSCDPPRFAQAQREGDGS
jgi:DNA polymerase III delta subunit